jgi:hypothetical protein
MVTTNPGTLALLKPALPRNGDGDKFCGMFAPERRAVLRELKALLRSLGVANDAQDHGNREEAERTRRDSCAAILALLARHPFLGELLPTLEWEVESGHVLGFGWSVLEDSVDAWLAVTGARPGDP